MKVRQKASARAVEAVSRRFEDWRRDPGRGRRIPEDLWRAAIDVAAQHGIWRTARALRVNNGELKRRLEAARREGEHGGAQAAAFVELPPTMVGAGAECVVEIEDPRGTRLRVRLPGWVVPDLAALAREFRRGAS
jgi:hypothetical protein